MKRGKFQLITAMLVFGSIGLFVRRIPFTSGQIALARGLIGSVFLFVVGAFIQKSLSWERVRANLRPLLIGGIAVGGNWVLLFQAYKFTTISVATICYYFAPVIVMFVSPLILKERLSLLRTVCILAAMAGMFCVAGGGGGAAGVSVSGVLCGIGAALFYATVMLSNKFLKDITDAEISFTQLAIATIFLLPYVLFTDGLALPESGVTWTAVTLLLIVGVVHTGVCYYLYFSSLQKLPGQTVAVLSYIDPVSAIIMSWLFLHEGMSPLQIAGAVLVLGATLSNELFGGDRKIETED